MLVRLMSMGCAALIIGACSGAASPDPDLALRCELAQCECQDAAHPFSPASVIWNQDGTAGCAEGRKLAMKNVNKPETRGPGGIVLPTYDDCAHSGMRSGAGRVGRGARVSDCGF